MLRESSNVERTVSAPTSPPSSWGEGWRFAAGEGALPNSARLCVPTLHPSTTPRPYNTPVAIPTTHPATVEQTLTIDSAGPLPVKRPASVAELSALVREARAAKRGVYPVGGGTTL